MTEAQRLALANELLNNPLVDDLLNEIEWSAINRGVAADQKDDEARAAAMAEVRAIRSFRSKLKFIPEQAKAVAKGAPA